MFAKTYRNDGLPMEASLQNLKIVGCTYSFAIERLYPTSQSKNSERKCSSFYREARERLEEVTLYKNLTRDIVALKNAIFCSCRK